MKVREQGFIKISYTTGIILGGIIFLSSLFSGWLTQSKDINIVAAAQKEMSIKMEMTSNRVTVLEQCVINTKDDVTEIKKDLKDITRHLSGLVIGLNTTNEQTKSMLKGKVRDK